MDPPHLLFRSIEHAGNTSAQIQMSRRIGIEELILVLAIVAVGSLGLWGVYQAYRRSQYPYGYNPTRSSCLWFDLIEYAEAHQGFFPCGGETPDASLGMLASMPFADVYLGGKAVPYQVVQEAIKRDGHLGSDSCSWHYVPGLTLNNDSQLAIAWDKIPGLGPNGERLEKQSRTVVYVGGSTEDIDEGEWPAFLAKQEKLMACRDEHARQGTPILTAKIRFPSGEVVNHYQGAFELDEHWQNSSLVSANWKGTKPGLHWYRNGVNKLVGEDGAICQMTLTLPVERLRSKPVSVKFRKGNVEPSTIVFQMEEIRE
jgi:hypothetical protein